MMKIFRNQAPSWLVENYKIWGKEYSDRLTTNTQYIFSWKQHEGVAVNKKLEEQLKLMTNNHCAFCDSWPIGSMIQFTIEHFRPKQSFAYLAYAWANLFPCCRICQEKSIPFEKILLKPDKEEYFFEKYFMVNYRTGELEINPLASIEDQIKADFTMKFYKLNEKERPQTRQYFFEKGRKDVAFSLNDYPYRFMFLP